MTTSYTPPCHDCAAKCCQYVSLPIDKPKSTADYQHIKWYLLHQNVSVNLSHDDNWYVNYETPCGALNAENECTIYENRPPVCRDHGRKKGDCEYYGTPHKLYFDNVEDYEKYLAENNLIGKFKHLLNRIVTKSKLG